MSVCSFLLNTFLFHKGVNGKKRKPETCLVNYQDAHTSTLLNKSPDSTTLKFKQLGMHQLYILS